MTGNLVQLLLNGAIAGSVYALIAIGFVLLHNGTGIVNFGYGDQLMLGGYLVILLQQFAGAPMALAVLLALLISGAIGLSINYGVMRPLSGRPLLIPIIATLALGTAMREGIRAVMGPNAWPMPFLVSPTPIRLGGVSIVPSDLAILAVALLVMLALYLFFAFTRYGQAVLAACANPTGALIVGIPAGATVAAIWVLSSMLAALAGILIAPLATLTPDIGLVSIKGFSAAVLGGFASLPGAIVGGLLLGVTEVLAGYYVSSALKDIVSYVVLVVVIVVMPSGLLGDRIVRKV